MHLDQGLKSDKALLRSTIAKSFKYGGTKDTNEEILELFLNDLIMMVKDKDLQVKKNSIEGLNTIVHYQPNTIKNYASKI